MICLSRSDLGAVALLCALTEARQPPPVDLGLVETPVIEPPQFRGSLAMKKSYVCDASRPASTTNLRETRMFGTITCTCFRGTLAMTWGMKNYVRKSIIKTVNM